MTPASLRESHARVLTCLTLRNRCLRCPACPLLRSLHGSKVANGTAALAADTDAPSDQAAGGRMLGTPVAVPSTPTGQHYPQVQPSTPTGASAAGQQQEQALRSQLQRLETKRA